MWTFARPGTAVLDYMPHGQCYFWQPSLLALHAVSDAIVALAYFAIAPAIAYFAYKRRDLPYRQVFIWVGGFIVACGLVHLLGVWTLWHPNYWLWGMVKAIDAIVSLYAAGLVVALMPQALRLPVAGELRALNASLAAEVAQRREAEAALQQLNEDLEARVRERTAALERQAADRAAAEATLRDREAQLAAFFDAAAVAGVGTIVYGSGDRFLRVNGAIAQLTGLAPAEHLGKTVAEVFPGRDDLARDICTTLQRVRETGQPAFARERSALVPVRAIAAPDGSAPSRQSRTWLSYIFPFASARNAEPLVGTIVVDITERKRAEAQLRMLSQACEQSPVSIVITDAQGTIEYVNPKFEALTGYTAAEAIGQNPRILKSGDMSPSGYRTLWATLAAGREWRGEFHNKKKNGELFWESASISPLRDADGRITHFVAVKEDITLRKVQEAAIAYQSTHDALTHLPNRDLAIDRLHQALKQADRAGTQVAVLFVDLDRFKDINDARGHDWGDRLLQEIAQRLAGCFRDSDTVARFGGDEFLVVLPQLDSRERAAQAATRILTVLSQPLLLDGEELFASASVGVALYPGDGDEPNALVRNADAAMYAAKQSGRNRFCFFQSSLNEQAWHRLQLANRLRRAVDRQELDAAFQPLVDLQSGRIVGAEALMRWYPPGRDAVSPACFIPIAEETGAIVTMGYWMLERACRELCQWQQAFGPSLRMAVNLSPRQFRDPGLVERVAAILAAAALDPPCLELEVTEGLFVGEVPGAAAAIARLHEFQVRLAVDDFGTGYSALGYLQRFPLNSLKLDRAFVANLPHNSQTVAIVRAVVSMAQGLGLETIAEGVETAAQADFLQAIGCNYGQGYWFGRPVSAAAFRTLLARSGPGQPDRSPAQARHASPSETPRDSPPETFRDRQPSPSPNVGE